MSEAVNIPHLRFPEFSGDWEEKKLSDISDVRDGTHESPKYVLDGFPLITSKNLLSNGSIDFENINLVSEEDYTNINKRSKVDINDILFGMIGTIGNPVIVKETGFAIKNVALIKQQKELLNKFMIFYLSGNSIAKQFYIENTGGTQKFLALGVIRSLKIKFPPDTEQQKIAAFLTAVDNKIEQLSKKQELLGEYKKGLMQQIFSQAIRFKADDGSEFPDWEEKKLGDFDSLVHGDGDWILSQDITKNGKYEIVQLGNIGFGLFVDKPLKTISEDKFTEINGTQIRKGDLLINRMVDSKLYCCLLKSDDDFITSVDVCWIRESKYFDNYFLMNLILFGKNQNKLLNLSSGSGRVRISKKNLFNKFYFELPSIDEQTKIANFLSSIDNKIEQVGKQLDESKQFKKALLQQMFV